jgi:hypothetical protein
MYRFRTLCRQPPTAVCEDDQTRRALRHVEVCLERPVIAQI